MISVRTRDCSIRWSAAVSSSGSSRKHEIQRAELNPPTDTRAYFRGRCVSKFAKALYGASWTSVLFDIGNTTIKKVPLMDPHRGTQALTRALLDDGRFGRCPDRETQGLTNGGSQDHDEAALSSRP